MPATTDNVQLTGGDKRTYTGAAQAQRNQGFEQIDVTFDHPPAPEQDDHSSPGTGKRQGR